MKCHSDRPRGRRQAWGAAGSAVLPGVRAALRAEHARPQQRFLQRRCAEDPEHVVMAAARAFVGPGRVEKGTLVFGEHKRLRTAVLGKSQGIGERGAAESVWGVVSGGATAPGHRAGLALDLIAS